MNCFFVRFVSGRIGLKADVTREPGAGASKLALTGKACLAPACLRQAVKASFDWQGLPLPACDRRSKQALTLHA